MMGLVELKDELLRAKSDFYLRMGEVQKALGEAFAKHDADSEAAMRDYNEEVTRIQRAFTAALTGGNGEGYTPLPRVDADPDVEAKARIADEEFDKLEAEVMKQAKLLGGLDDTQRT